MRVFLIVMCDVFLSLYLMQLSNARPTNVLTVGDFYALKTINETLKADKEKLEKSLQEKMQKQDELAASEKEKLEAKLLEEKEKTQEAEKSLAQSNTEKEKISQDLKDKEQLLVKLNEEISAKEKLRRKMETAYQQDIKTQKEELEKKNQRVQQLQAEANDAKKLADQMKEDAAQAEQKAQAATTAQQNAIKLKDEALKGKAAAEKKAGEAVASRQVAEAEKGRALKARDAATAQMKIAEGKAQELAIAIQDIKQSGEAAYANNVRPYLQTLNVTYSHIISNEKSIYKDKLTLLPVKIGEQAIVVFPSTQIGFTEGSPQLPEDLAITYQNQNISEGWINKDEDLIALALPGYKGTAGAPYPIDTPIDEFMPVLLALRNSGSVGLLDKIRWIAEDYFMVNRDYLKLDKDGSLKYEVKGFRGTGTHGERIIRGDQLIDLKGRLIGVSNDANRVVRINSLGGGWTKIVFKDNKNVK